MISTTMRTVLSAGVLMFLAGCGGEGGYKDYDKTEKSPPAETHAHDHEHAHGPHDGHVVELGDHAYHGEVCYDAKNKKITVYVLDGEAKNAHPIAEKELTLSLMIDGKAMPFTLKAVPLEGEPEGKSSRFEIAEDLTIAEHIKDEEDLNGGLSVTIDGKPYTGKIEHDHEHHDHDHGKDGAKEGAKPDAAKPDSKDAEAK